MPSSPKSFYPRTSQYTRSRSTVVILCSVIGLAGFIFGFTALTTQKAVTYKCIHSKPKSVSVSWDQNGNSGNLKGLDGNEIVRHKVMGFVGIQTGFGSAGRRKSLRMTWMPSDHQALQRASTHNVQKSLRETWMSSDHRGLQRLEEATGLAFKFMIGRTKDSSKMSELKKEVAEYDDFILLDIEEEYSKLPYKTLAFFKAAYALYDADFYVKADDDIYLRPDRLSLLLAKDRTHSQTYLGCMKKGPVFTDPKLKWYEPLSPLLGKEYFLHAYGPLYALSADVVASLVALRNNSFRMFSNEDVTIGAWMLAMNVNHEDNRQLCQSECSPTSIAVWDIPKCSGLCNPEKKLLELHAKESCSQGPAAMESDD